jgi:hypothetical protein
MLALVVNFHPELRRRARLHQRPMRSRHTTSRRYPDHFPLQTDHPTRTCGERSRTIVILPAPFLAGSERSESKDLSLPSRRLPTSRHYPDHSAPYLHDSVQHSDSLCNLCVLSVSALDCSFPGFPLNPQLSTFNRILLSPSAFSVSSVAKILSFLSSPPATFSYLLYFQLLAHSLRLSKTQPFCFQSIPHSLRKTPGVGHLSPSSRRTKMKPKTANAAVLSIRCAYRTPAGR